MRIFTLEDVAQHARAGDCWVVHDNKIYDVSFARTRQAALPQYQQQSTMARAAFCFALPLDLHGRPSRVFFCQLPLTNVLLVPAR